ncbi:translocation/assembly module TamB domain-containing protein [Paludibacterium paludis]|uniref:DUF490 domain-containing protein n=1 Tax=Paludibacterium paludis TaxID=1225769 RepID=A0A918P2F0_9NEIS|nr:translocation/assembly module TamB domain-containing protein [Paludibacterium paludis]GGY15822.1 DUF490 domain-containing protein [Paludibacterium paludis]
MSDFEPVNDSDTVSKASGPAAPRPRKRGRRLLAGALAALLLMFGALAWLGATEAGFAVLWRAAAWASGGALTVGKARGTLIDRFSLDDIQWSGATERVRVTNVAVDWSAGDVWRRTLTIRRLAVGHVSVISVPGARKPPSSPTVLPESLSLPFDVNVDALTLASLGFDGEGPSLYGVSASYRYRADNGHRLRIDRLDSPWGRGRAALFAADRRPFALSGDLAVDGSVESLPVAGKLDVSGSLAAVRISGGVTGKAVNARVDGEFAPFSTDSFSIVRRLDILAGGVNPHAWLADLPDARLNIAAYLRPAAGRVSGGMSVLNLEPGDMSRNRLPVRSMAAEFLLGQNALDLTFLGLDMPAGHIRLSGTVGNMLDMTLALKEVALKGMHADAPDDVVNGAFRIGGSVAEPRIEGKAAGTWLGLELNGGIVSSPLRHVALRKLGLRAGGGELTVSGSLELEKLRRFDVSGALSHIDPSRFGASWPRGDVSARLSAAGKLEKGPEGRLNLVLSESRLSGQPLTGRVDAELVPERLKRLAMDLSLARNRLQAQGSWGAAGDRLKFALDAPALGLLGPGFSGSLDASAEVSGTPKVPVVSGRVKADRLALPGDVFVQSLSGAGDLRADNASPFRVAVSGDGLRVAQRRIDGLRLVLEGTRARHHLEFDGRMQAERLTESWLVRASGGLAQDRLVWGGSLDRLELAGSVPVSLQAPVRLSVAKDSLDIGAARLSALGGTLALASLSRKGDGSLSTRGQWRGLSLAELEHLVSLPVKAAMTLDAEWAIDTAREIRGTIGLRRAAGDILLPGSGKDGQPLGLNGLDATVSMGNGQAQWTLAARTRHGDLEGTGSLPLGSRLPDARTPLSGNVRLSLPALSTFAALAGPSLELGGRVNADLSFNGPLGAPHWQGRVGGDHLLFADRRTGIRLADGTLAARITDERVELDTLRFSGGKGYATAHGALALKDGGPDARVQVELNAFSVFDRPSRRLVVSGNAELAMAGRKVSLTGKLRADQGRVELARLGTPSLSDDVVVKGRAAPEPSALASLPLSVALTLDLGDRFRFSGQGLDVELTGQALLTAEPGMAPAAKGQVRVVKGRYKAYGQDLDIEYGVISFAGPLDNPGLNVRARRRLSPVGAGVEVTGSVATPQIRLIADEAMSDRDKLAWLVLGRASSGSDSDNNSMAASAGALLAGTLNERIGLFDDLGMTQRNERTLADGRISPAEQVVTVGKQLTQEFYLGYEYGITSAHQAVKMIYSLSKSWSLVLRAGTEASAETRYTLRFD